jgi:hypothetical protein
MLARTFVVGFVAVATATSAQVAEYLTEVTSEVYQATGTTREIATRAQTCISQHLASGMTGGQLIINAVMDGGIIVANSAIEYGSLPRRKIRSRFTFEARDGRFRTQQANLESFNDQFNVGCLTVEEGRRSVRHVGSYCRPMRSNRNPPR